MALYGLAPSGSVTLCRPFKHCSRASFFFRVSYANASLTGRKGSSDIQHLSLLGSRSEVRAVPTAAVGRSRLSGVFMKLIPGRDSPRSLPRRPPACSHPPSICVVFLFHNSLMVYRRRSNYISLAATSVVTLAALSSQPAKAGNTTCVSNQLSWYSDVVGESPCEFLQLSLGPRTVSSARRLLLTECSPDQV